MSKSTRVQCGVQIRWFQVFALVAEITTTTKTPLFCLVLNGLVVWGQAATVCKSHMDKILILQKSVVQLMNFANYNSHAVPSLLIHDVHNNLAPSNLSGMFTLSHQIHNHNTQSLSAGNYYINCSRLNQHKKSFSKICCKIWNSIQGNLRNLRKHIFK